VVYEALAYYANTLGLDEVNPREVQSAIDVLKASKLVMRNGDRGPVTVTNPIVRDSWLRVHTKGESIVDQSSILEVDDD
jgi:hypothetical protein